MRSNRLTLPLPLLLLSLLLFASCQGRSGTPPPTATTPTTASPYSKPDSPKSAKYDALIAGYAAVDQFSGAVLIQQNGHTIYEKSVGYANRELKVPITPDSLFRIGSVTKQFTAAAIMKLVEQGKCRLEDPLDRYLPDYPPAPQITIHHLLSHTAGVPNFTSFPRYRYLMRKHHTISQVIDIFRALPLEFVPGSRFKYSNSGYVLLTAVIEKASGVSYEAYLKKEIWNPAGLTSTRYDQTRPVIKNRVSGYQMGPGKKLVNASFIDMSVPVGAGGVLSTARDLCRWDSALRDGRVLSVESQRKMYTPVKRHYGYGWKISKLYKTQIIHHSGGINGFVSHFMRLPEKKLCIVVLANHTFARPGRMAFGLASIWFGKPAHIPRVKKAISLPLEQLKVTVGTYRATDAPMTATVFLKKRNLYIQIKGQRAFRIYPEASRHFFMKEIEVAFSFTLHKGRVVSMTSLQNGRKTHWLRTRTPEK